MQGLVGRGLAGLGLVAVLVSAACGHSSEGAGGSDAPSAVDVPVVVDAPCGGCQPVADPHLPGSLSTTTSSFELLVGTTKIPLTIYLPGGPGPYPVVVFHHGFQLGVELYASYGVHLASWGYVVVMPQMPGGLIGGPTHKELAGYMGKVLDWVTTTATAPTGPLAGKADATRIALAGHSMGGKISMLTATADARVDAVFGIDPVDAVGSPLPVSPADYPSVTPELMDRISVPFAVLGETTNATCSGLLCQACAPAADNFHQYYEHAVHPALEIEVLGASHMSFLDDPACGTTCSACSAGTDDQATTRSLTRGAMTAFFNVVLRGDTGYLSYLTGADMAADVAAGRVIAAHKNGF